MMVCEREGEGRERERESERVCVRERVSEHEEPIMLIELGWRELTTISDIFSL